MTPITLQSIQEKVETDERLTPEEGEYLFRDETDLHAVGRMADIVRRRKNKDITYYNVNSHLNPTNACIYRCPLCAYSRDADDKDAYVMSDKEIAKTARDAASAGCTELHIVGGLHPDKDYAWYRGIIATVRAAAPRLHIKAYSAVEIARFAEMTSQPVDRILEDLKEVGLGSLPGGGAEIFAPKIRNQICPKKPDAQAWFNVHRAAHRLGLRSNATMLYGHVETKADRLDHLLQLRAFQDQTEGFQAFVPLSFHPASTQFAHLEKTTGLDDLRTIAVSRLILDNFDHIKAYWISLGVATAQIAQSYGADDFDGTVVQELIHHEAGADSPTCISVAEISQLIKESGHRPVERDTLYQGVRR